MHGFDVCMIDNTITSIKSCLIYLDVCMIDNTITSIKSCLIRHSPPGMAYGFVRIFIFFYYSSAAKVSG